MRSVTVVTVFRFLMVGFVAAGLVGGPWPSPVRAQADVVESARGLCNQATQIWESQDQWAIRQLSLVYNELTNQMSPEEFDEGIRTMYRGWTPSFGIEQPCDKDVLTFAARSGITRQEWDTFNRCLQSGIDARRSTVETFVREHQSMVQNAMVGTYNLTMADASRDYLTSLARGAGLRTCRP
jgi:hypothetical protein